jgi:hypothetical protein
MGILGWTWDKIPILGIIGRRNRQEEGKLKELKKQTKEMKKQTKELKKLQKNKK